jgi:aarF domain-containing kinase
MTELQKLCDKVPSFPDDIAMALLEEELGQPWQAVYSELSPSPIAAGNYIKELCILCVLHYSLFLY